MPIFLKRLEKKDYLIANQNSIHIYIPSAKTEYLAFLKQVPKQEVPKLENIQDTSQIQNMQKDVLFFWEYEKIPNKAVNQFLLRRKVVFRMCNFNGKLYDQTASFHGHWLMLSNTVLVLI